jgi:hypothetical protein
MNTCPHCGADPCLLLWRKLCLGPASSATCQVCGCRVGVDVVKACMALLPTFLLILVAGFGLLHDPIALIALLVACLGVTALLYALWVPLLADELTNARIVAAGRERIAAQKSQRPRG